MAQAVLALIQYRDEVSGSRGFISGKGTADIVTLFYLATKATRFPSAMSNVFVIYGANLLALKERTQRRKILTARHSTKKGGPRLMENLNSCDRCAPYLDRKRSACGVM
jgi:hypothetical protein